MVNKIVQLLQSDFWRATGFAAVGVVVNMSGLLATAVLLVTYMCALNDPTYATSKEFKIRQHKHLLGLMKRQQQQQILQAPGPNLDSSNEDSVGKRQEFLFDDYGHMRFGKREESDDYGHLRFGRSDD